jgi:hypothetical protein
MTAKKKLKDAMSTLDDAIGVLKQAQARVPEVEQIKRAIRELEDARELIRRASREVE